MLCLRPLLSVLKKLFLEGRGMKKSIVLVAASAIGSAAVIGFSAHKGLVPPLQASQPIAVTSVQPQCMNFLYNQQGISLEAFTIRGSENALMEVEKISLRNRLLISCESSTLDL